MRDAQLERPAGSATPSPPPLPTACPACRRSWLREGSPTQILLPWWARPGPAACCSPAPQAAAARRAGRPAACPRRRRSWHRASPWQREARRAPMFTPLPSPCDTLPLSLSIPFHQLSSTLLGLFGFAILFSILQITVITAAGVARWGRLARRAVHCQGGCRLQEASCDRLPPQRHPPSRLRTVSRSRACARGPLLLALTI